MKLIKFTKDNMYLRHSLVRLAPCAHISVKLIYDYLKGGVKLFEPDARIISQADRCIKYIECVKLYKMPINTEDIIISLATYYPYNFLEETFLRADFPKELDALHKILLDNIEKDYSIFTAAKKVMDYITYSRLVKQNTLSVLFLLSNLMIVHSGYVMILEDTDSVDPGLLLEMSVLIDDHA